MPLKYSIINDGMGAMLNPPNDPEHSYSVVAKAGHREVASWSLRAALESNEVPEDIKTEVNALLDANKGGYTDEWEHSVYNYFRHCYSHDGINRSASDCKIDPTNSEPADHHLAFMLIKSFFPDAKPNMDLIHNNGDKGAWSNKK